MVARGASVIQLHPQRGNARMSSPPPRMSTAADTGQRRVLPPPPPSDKGEQDLSDMEIPTFIRRQMD